MLSSAVSLLLLAAAVETPEQVLSTAEARAWSKVRPSLVSIQNGPTVSGLGVCVDKKGHFLAHRAAVPFPVLFGRLSSGLQVELREIAQDETTQLVLLRSASSAAQTVTPATLGSEPERTGGTLLAALVGGPVRAEFVSGEKYGIVNPSRRLVPLNELRFESHTPQVGGGLVFNLDGRLIGVLGATLGAGESQSQRQAGVAKSIAASPLGGPGGGARLSPPAVSAPRTLAPGPIGPGVLTVAYSVSSSVLHRVVEGLLSPSHKVVHPAIGVFCKDAPSGGAEVISIQKGSPSEAAGLRVGDVIFGIGDANIANQFDVARVTMRLRIGTNVEVKVRREGQEIVILVAVGAA